MTTRRHSLLRAVSSRQLVAGYLVASAAMAGAGVLSYRDAARLVEATNSSNHTLRVVGALNDARAELRAAETEQRGFVITGLRQYVTAYRRSEVRLRERLANVDRLTADNPPQQARLRAAMPIIETRLARLDEGMAVRTTSGMAAATALITEGEGERLADEVSRRLDEMEQHERALLVERETRHRTVTAQSMRTLVAGNVAGVTLLGGVFFVLAWQTRERRQVEERLRQAMSAAEAATRAKSEFLANMSHEIRTPLTGVLGMLELTRTSPLTPQQARYIDIANASARSLLAIVNDVLDLSKIEAGRLQVEAGPFDLALCLESGLAALRLAAQQKGLAFRWIIADNVPRELVGDAGRLQQILVNLVGNAVKFTERGEVTVHVAHLETVSGATRLTFTVADSGIGIPEDRQAAVFEPFTQADGSTTRQHGGTGLGLTIASRLAQMLGGTLWLDRSVTTGATFHFTARFALLAAAAGTTPHADPAARVRHARSLHVLLAEDTESISIFVEALLRRWGHRVTTVTNGLEAVDAVLGSRPDLVLMDGHMPECDGARATAIIRAREATAGGRVPIIAMTARAMLGDREACLEAGMDGYLPKPVDVVALFAVIGGVAGIAESSLDDAAILDHVGGDAALLKRISTVFMEESRRLSGQLAAAMERGDREAIEHLAHSLKSAIGHWTAGRAYDAADALETAARHDRMTEAPAAWALVRAELPGVQDAVAQLAAASRQWAVEA